MHETNLHYYLCWLGIEGLQIRAWLDFSRQKGIKCKLSNVISSSQRHSYKLLGAHFKYFSIQNNVQTARESSALFVWFDSLRPINNLSVMWGRVFLAWTSIRLGLMCLAQGHYAGDARTRGLSVSSQALYQWAAATLYLKLFEYCDHTCFFMH